MAKARWTKAETTKLVDLYNYIVKNIKPDLRDIIKEFKVCTAIDRTRTQLKSRIEVFFEKN